MGEFLVLERLKGTAGNRTATQQLIQLGWDHAPEAISQFVRRAVADYPKDSAASIIQEPVLRTAEQRDAWSRLVGDLLLLQNDSQDPQVIRNLQNLRELAHNYPLETNVQQNRADAEVKFGLLLVQETRFALADDQLSEGIRLSPPGSETHAKALNNRGVARHCARSKEEALADYLAVLAITDASDEVRACALNNRADISAEEGKFEEAIQDRSRVLDLAETSFNRRYIAYIRRSAEYLELGRTNEALNDLAAILRTEDIVLEQKMQARLHRARILKKQQRNSEAISDLDEIVRCPVNFPGTAAQALLLRGNAHFETGKIDLALADFAAALARNDSDGDTNARAYLEYGVVLQRIGRLKDALTALITARDHPEADERVKHRAEDAISSLGNI
jgi:tetratricopeptide (TPR) repeat protein